MPAVTQLDTPGSLRDFPAGSPFYGNWHTFVASRIGSTTPGSGGGEFFDQSEWNVDVAGERMLVWMGFPRTQMVVASRDDRQAAFVAGEDRELQNEYLEWRAVRNGAQKITKVVFVTETPEYWEQIAAFDRARLVALYQDLVDPAVAEADLFSGGTYNRRNRWNTTDGIVHYIQSINTLDAALGLVQGSVNSGGIRDNYEASMSYETSADPRVALDVGMLARKGLSLAFREPIGLYMVDWDDTGWTKPDGSPVDDYWTVRRGHAGAALRLEYEVPPGSGFIVGDIRIGGRRIKTGGEIAEHITVAAGAIAGRRLP